MQLEIETPGLFECPNCAEPEAQTRGSWDGAQTVIPIPTGRIIRTRHLDGSWCEIEIVTGLPYALVF
jgi:hypothetical protein